MLYEKGHAPIFRDELEQQLFEMLGEAVYGKVITEQQLKEWLDKREAAHSERTCKICGRGHARFWSEKYNGMVHASCVQTNRPHGKTARPAKLRWHLERFLDNSVDWHGSSERTYINRNYHMDDRFAVAYSLAKCIKILDECWTDGAFTPRFDLKILIDYMHAQMDMLCPPVDREWCPPDDYGKK